MNPFENYRQSVFIKDCIKSKNVIVGRHSYYSGYYYGKSFEDCVMYLDVADDDKSPIDRLIIGEFCSIATGVKFMMGGNHCHNYDWVSTYPFGFLDDEFAEYFNDCESERKTSYNLKGDTIIGCDVWIGAEAMIMPGVQIADGAVIGARSVVTKNVGPYEIWAGNPARLIKKRFVDHAIQKLLQIKWWDWTIEKIKDNLEIIRSSDVELLWSKFQDMMSL
jgi:chloramphenicol O-acetyltransferase type B